MTLRSLNLQIVAFCTASLRSRFVCRLCAFLLLLWSAAACRSLAQAPPATGYTTAFVTDSTFGNMNAFAVDIPAGWQLQGAVLGFYSCQPHSAAFRAYSRDGLSDMALLPMVNWQVAAKASAREGNCLAMTEELTAQQFLDGLVRTLQAPHVVGPAPVPAAYREKFAAMRRELANALVDSVAPDPKVRKAPATISGDVAAERVEVQNGTFVVEERLRARVWCVHAMLAGQPLPVNCSARVDVLRAPKGQLDALIELVDAHSLGSATPLPEWEEAVHREVMRRETSFDARQEYRRRVPPRETALVRCQAAAFHVAEDGAPTVFNQPTAPELASSGDLLSSVVDNSTANVFDLADYVLYFDRRADDFGCSGRSFVRTWVSDSGEWYRTANPGADPNGRLAGVWKDETRPGPTNSLRPKSRDRRTKEAGYV